jgi:hypothetical protein
MCYSSTCNFDSRLFLWQQNKSNTQIVDEKWMGWSDVGGGFGGGTTLMANDNWFEDSLACRCRDWYRCWSDLERECDSLEGNM